MSAVAVLKALFLGWGVGFVAAIPAGPVSAAVFAQGIEGKKNTTPLFILGAIVVDAVYCALAFLGVSLYLKPWISNPIVGLLAMVVLLVLGYKMATNIPVFETGPTSAEAAQKEGSALAALGMGFFLNAANPILPVSWTGIVVVLRDVVGEGHVVLWSFAIMAALGMGSWLFVLHRIARVGKAFLSPKAVILVIRGLGLVVMGIGVYYGVWTLVHWFGSSGS